MIDRETEDMLLRDILNSSAYKIPPPPPDDPAKYRYWKEGELDLRTCHECHYTEFKSKDDGHWIVYVTYEHAAWFYDQILQKKDTKCKTCSEW